MDKTLPISALTLNFSVSSFEPPISSPNLREYPLERLERAVLDIRYAGYIEQEARLAARNAKLDRVKLPPELDYPGFYAEAQEKLSAADSALVLLQKTAYTLNYMKTGMIAVCILLASCSGRVSGSLYDDGSAELSLQASIEPRMSGLIRTLSRLNNPSSGADPILNGPRIAASMAAAPGIKGVSFRNISAAAIEGVISLTRADAFLGISGGQGFIAYEQTSTGGKVTIILNRNTAPRLIAVLSPDVGVYLEALMAPVATGEVISKAEYLALVRSVYGKAIADEIAGSRIHAALDFPGVIAGIRGGSASGANKNRGDFDIPLADLLVLEGPLEYEVSWKR